MGNIVRVNVASFICDIPNNLIDLKEVFDLNQERINM